MASGEKLARTLRQAASVFAARATGSAWTARSFAAAPAVPEMLMPADPRAAQRELPGLF